MDGDICAASAREGTDARGLMLSPVPKASPHSENFKEVFEDHRKSLTSLAFNYSQKQWRAVWFATERRTTVTVSLAMG